MTVLVAFDVDGTLIDTRPSFDRIIRELSGATPEDLRTFRAHGGFNDDWELTRAAIAWIGAGRPPVLEGCEGVCDVVARCGHDPGDLSARCIELYRGGYWKDERPLIDGARLGALAGRLRVAACTGRDRWELARAEELLGFRFPSATTAEDVKKPAPAALLRLVDPGDDWVVSIGDSHADRRTLSAAAALRPGTHFCYVHVSAPDTAAHLVEALLACGGAYDIPRVAARFGEPR